MPGAPGNPREFNFKYIAPYFQDDWRVTSRVTVNMGLRWDYRNVPYETQKPDGLAKPRLRARRLARCRSVTCRLAASWMAPITRRPADEVPRTRIGSRSLLPGLALPGARPKTGKSVFRGGYGVFYDSAEGREIDGSADVYPYVSRNNYLQSVGQPTPLRTSDSLFPSFESQGLATPAANTFLAVSQSPEPRNPYMQQWSLGVQRELIANTTLEVNYIGTKGTNLLMRRNIAQALEFSPNRPTVAERKPYPNFVTYIDSDWGGRSRYDAFNTKLEHRGRGSLLTLAYTWAKSTDTKSAAAGIGATGYNGWQGFLNNHDPERDYGLSDFDVDHRLVGSFVYNIPWAAASVSPPTLAA